MTRTQAYYSFNDFRGNTSPDLILSTGEMNEAIDALDETTLEGEEVVRAVKALVERTIPDEAAAEWLMGKVAA